MVKIGWGVEVERRSKGKGCFLPHLFRTLPNLKSFTNVYELNYIIKIWYKSCRLMYYVTGGQTMCQMVELTLHLASQLMQSIRIRHIFDIPTWILPSEVVWMLWVWMNGSSLTEEHNASGDLIKLANGIVWRRDKSV